MSFEKYNLADAAAMHDDVAATYDVVELDRISSRYNEWHA